MIEKGRYQLLLIVCVLCSIMIQQSCTHDTLMMDDMETDPMDTMTNPMDTMEVIDDDCDTENISYSDFMVGVFDASCNGCHSTSAAFGGVILDTYAGVVSEVDKNKLYGAINWDTGFKQMPQGGDQLDSCSIAKIKSWIDDGAKDN